MLRGEGRVAVVVEGEPIAMRAAGRAAAWSGLDASFRMAIVDERDVHLN